MKKTIFAIALLLITSIVNAKTIKETIIENGSYTNSQGVTITLGNYNKMQEHMTEAEIDSLTKHLYKQIDESTSISGYENKVIETVYTTIANDIFVLEVNELTQEEYNQKQKIFSLEEAFIKHRQNKLVY